MSEIVTARGVVHGKVQGVWFRAFTRERALERGLTGYARNQPDGTVAFALCGPRNAVETVLGLLRQGPPLAQVTDLDVSWSADEDIQGFQTS